MNNSETNYIKLSEETGIEVYALNLLKSETGLEPEHLKTFFACTKIGYTDPNKGLQNTPNGRKTVLLPGIFSAVENGQDILEMTERIRPKIEIKGYRTFYCDKNGDGKGGIAIVRSNDEFTPLVHMQTNGINVGLTTFGLISQLAELDKELDLKLLGADFEWCHYEINKEPKDWNELAEKIYEICPDIVDQGVGDIESLAENLCSSKKLFLWFD